jgi:hypothetical protein
MEDPKQVAITWLDTSRRAKTPFLHATTKPVEMNLTKINTKLQLENRLA